MSIHAVGQNKPQPSEENTKIQVDSIQAPTGGVDARAPVGMMPPDVTLYTYNLMPAEYGMELRNGFREWQYGNETGGPILTLMTTLGLDAGIADNRLFACNKFGIYDVSIENGYVTKVTFPSQDEGSGHGVYCHYVDQSPKDWILYADAENGLYEYDGEADTWAIDDKITGGPAQADIRFCMVHKQRLWIFGEDTTTAYYLAIASKDGACLPFHFGAKFSHGGRLAGVFNWSVDGGRGVDDLFVVVSTAGDVIVYTGDDPSSADTWEVHGTYYIGEIPIGRRFAGEYAGDLYLLSAFGLTAMSDLLKGVDTQNSAQRSLSYKVARPLRNDLRNNLERYGWEPVFLPGDGSLIIMTPFEVGEDDEAIQYVMNLSTEAWGFWRGVPAVSAVSFKGFTYLGAKGGNILIMDSLTDGALLDDPEGTEYPIPFSIQSSTQNYGSPGLFKQVQMVRPDFWGTALPDYSIEVRYDFDTNEASYVPGAAVVAVPEPPGVKHHHPDGGGHSKLSGVGGMGRTCTIAMSGSASEVTRLVSWDVMWKTGGPI
jgi:hypothetical protein